MISISVTTAVCCNVTDLFELRRVCIPRLSAWLALFIASNRRVGSFYKSHPILLSNHKISGPSGKEQSTKQHRVAEENEFENFLESAEKADEQGINIQRLWLVLLLRLRQVSHVVSPTHSANRHIHVVKWKARKHSFNREFY